MAPEKSPAGDVLDVALPQIEGLKLTTTSLAVVDGALSEERWRSLLRTFSRMGTGVQWWIGDLLVEGGKRYGETYETAARATGRSELTRSDRNQVIRAVIGPSSR